MTPTTSLLHPLDVAECARCHGSGEVWKRGYSHNPNCGFPTPDPQYDEPYTCPTCHGSGATPKEQ